MHVYFSSFYFSIRMKSTNAHVQRFSLFFFLYIIIIVRLVFSLFSLSLAQFCNERRKKEKKTACAKWHWKSHTLQTLKLLSTMWCECTFYTHYYYYFLYGANKREKEHEKKIVLREKKRVYMQWKSWVDCPFFLYLQYMRHRLLNESTMSSSSSLIFWHG